MMFRIGFIREIFLEGIENINCYFVSVQFEYLLIKYVFLILNKICKIVL